MSTTHRTLFFLGCLLALLGGTAPGQDAVYPYSATTEQPGAGSSAYKVRVAVTYPGSEPEVRELAPTGLPSSLSIGSSPANNNTPHSTPTLVIDEFSTGSGTTDSALTGDPGVLATLFGKPITEEDVMRELWDRRGRETFDWIIGRDILKREMERLGLEVRDREVEERLQLHLESLRHAFPTLARPDDLTRAAAGMPLSEYRERTVWVELALRKIMQTALRPKEDELRKFFANMQAEFIQPERVKISQVFIAPQPDPDSDGIAGPDDWRRAERQIMEADSRLRMKEDFGEVARAYGTGGQLSRWVGRGELLRELEDAAFGISSGAITTPIRTSMGYHILTVEEKQDRTVPSFEEVRGEVLTRFEEAQFVSLAGEFMARLKARALDNGGLVLSGATEAFGQTKE